MFFHIAPGRARRIVLTTGLLALLAAGLSMQAQAQPYTLSSNNFSFGNQTVNLPSRVLGTVVTNISKNTIIISSMSVTGAGFFLSDGVAPYHLGPAQTFLYDVYFMPSAARAYSGQLTLVIAGTQVVIPLHGTGTGTGAAVSLSTNQMFFGGTPLGTVSPSQRFTITNTGTSNLAVQAVTANPPFTVSGFRPVTLAPGKSTSANVSFFANMGGGTTGTAVITYNVLPASGVSLAGTGTAATAFGITTYPALPAGTIGAPYLASLQSAGNTGAVSWSVLPGTAPNVLPPGLSLSASGTILGTISSSVAPGTYTPAIQATDAAGPTSTMNMSLIVKNTTGANCNNISWDVQGTSQPLVDIEDLSTGTYFGVQGGLYPNGRNMRPAGHDSDGVALANSIQPLDGNGNPSANGKYVFMSLGISTAKYTWGAFETQANADPDKNSHLVLVNGGEPSAGADKFADPSNPFWSTIFNFLLPNNGVTANQVVAVWYQDVFTAQQGTFPSDETGLQTALEETARNLHTFFPNLKLLYFSTWPYMGYCNGVAQIIYEPYGYEAGFAARNAIADQLSGLPSLNYNPARGAVNAPWMDWGPDLWSNGMIANKSGFSTSCQDLMPDCRHPSGVFGQPKWGAIMLNYFKLEDTSAPWFLSPSARGKMMK